jgi:hypothetical protein
VTDDALRDELEARAPHGLDLPAAQEQLPARPYGVPAPEPAGKPGKKPARK